MTQRARKKSVKAGECALYDLMLPNRGGSTRPNLGDFDGGIREQLRAEHALIRNHDRFQLPVGRELHDLDRAGLRRYDPQFRHPERFIIPDLLLAFDPGVGGLQDLDHKFRRGVYVAVDLDNVHGDHDGDIRNPRGERVAIDHEPEHGINDVHQVMIEVVLQLAAYRLNNTRVHPSVRRHDPYLSIHDLFNAVVDLRHLQPFLVRQHFGRRRHGQPLLVR